MPVSSTKTVNFGATKSGLAGSAGYRILDESGQIVRERTTTDISESFPGSGIYSSLVIFPDYFSGSILWDTGEESPVFATEEYNYTDNVAQLQQNVEDIAAHVNFIRGLTAGRWKIDRKSATMSFYDESGDNLLVSYELLDESGQRSIDAVFDRRIIKLAPSLASILTIPESILRND